MRKFLYFTFFCVQSVLSSLCAQAVVPDSTYEKPLPYASPYHVLDTFLKALNAGHPEQVSSLFVHPNYDEKARINVAWRLKQVLDGTGHIIYLNEVPQQADYVAPSSGKHQYMFVDEKPGIYLERQANGWYFPPRVVDEIEKWHDDIFLFGMDALLRFFPQIGSQYVGLLFWKWGALLILLACAMLLRRGLAICSAYFFRRFLSRSKHTQAISPHVLATVKPLSWVLIVGVLFMLIPVLQFPVHFSRYFILGLQIMFPVFVTMICYHLVDVLHVYLMLLAKGTKSTLDDQLVVLLRKVLKVCVVILGGLFMLDNLHIPIIPLLTGLSLGGLAFALAAQDTIKNFFGSLMIFVDKPFQVGDWITSGNIDGTVEEVGFRSTRIRTFRDSLIYVPNAALADSVLDNHGTRTYRRYYAKLCLPYETPVDRIESFIEGLRDILKTHTDLRKDVYEIHLHDFTKEGLLVMFYIFIKSPDWSKELAIRHQLNLRILRLADRLGMRFAYGMHVALSSRELHTTDTLRNVYSSEKKAPTSFPKR